MKRQIPNIITAMNLLSGSIAIVAALKYNNLTIAAYFIGLSAVFDFFDGMAARLLNVKSEIGKELDSLADVISFGLAPSVIIFLLLINATEVLNDNHYIHTLIPYLAFIIAIFSAFRLAKFNIDTRQSDYFIGLPTPANAMFLASFPLILQYNDDSIIANIINDYIFLICITLIFSYLLISHIRLFSLKIKNFTLKDNLLIYILIIISIILFIFLNFSAIPFIIIFYILLSLIGFKEKTIS